MLRNLAADSLEFLALLAALAAAFVVGYGLISTAIAAWRAVAW